MTMYMGFQQILSAIFAEEHRPPGHAAEEARARGVVGDVARPEERPEVHVGLRSVDAEHLRGRALGVTNPATILEKDPLRQKTKA